MQLDAPDVETGSVLESALVGQRIRADRHRTNFESLKAQHLTLKEVFIAKFNSSFHVSVQVYYTPLEGGGAEYTTVLEQVKINSMHDYIPYEYIINMARIYNII